MSGNTIGGSSNVSQTWQTQISQSKRPAENLGHATLRTGNSANALINSTELFKQYFKGEVDKIAGSLGRPVGEGFSEIAQSGLTAILDKTFSKMQAQFLDSGTMTDPVGLMRTAHSEAQEVLSTLRMVVDDMKSGANGKGAAPQLVKGKDGGYNLIRVAPKLENIVLKGGGAKGIGYPGALREMQDAGMLSNLKRVAGTSAGALTAVSLAIGQHPDKFEALSKGSMLGLLTGGKELTGVYPELGYKNGLNPSEAKPMIKLLDQIMCEEVKEMMATVGGEELDRRIGEYCSKQDPQLEPKTVKDRLTLLANPDFSGDRTGKMVTFNDMKMLHQLAPDKFREITLTGWDSHDQEPIVFRAGERYGDLPVAFAARISMAHPLIATGITLPEKYGHGDHALQDGGIGSNMPSEVFYADDRDLASMDTTGNIDLQETRSRTALLIFDEKEGLINKESKALKSMHSPEAQKLPQTTYNPITLLGSAISKSIAHNDEMGIDSRYDKFKQYGAGPNGFVVAHGSMGTMSVLAWKSTKETAIQESRDVMREQIALRHDQAYAVDVPGPEEAYLMLDTGERRMIYDQGPPVRYPEMTDENFKAATDFFNLARNEFAPKSDVRSIEEVGSKSTGESIEEGGSEPKLGDDDNDGIDEVYDTEIKPLSDRVLTEIGLKQDNANLDS